MTAEELKVGESYIYRRTSIVQRTGEKRVKEKKVKLVGKYPFIAVFKQKHGKKIALTWWEVMKRILRGRRNESMRRRRKKMHP